MYKKILLPTDGSEYSVREIERATKLLAEGGEIIILSEQKTLRKLIRNPLMKQKKMLKLWRMLLMIVLM